MVDRKQTWVENVNYLFGDILKVLNDTEDSTDKEKLEMQAFIPIVKKTQDALNKPELPEGSDALLVTEENLTSVVYEIVYNLTKIYGVPQLYPRIQTSGNIANIQIFRRISDNNAIFNKSVEYGQYIIFKVKEEPKY